MKTKLILMLLLAALAAQAQLFDKEYLKLGLSKAKFKAWTESNGNHINTFNNEKDTTDYSYTYQLREKKGDALYEYKYWFKNGEVKTVSMNCYSCTLNKELEAFKTELSKAYKLDTVLTRQNPQRTLYKYKDNAVSLVLIDSHSGRTLQAQKLK